MVSIVDKRRMAVERIEYSRELIEGFRRKGVVLPSSLRLLKDAERELSGKNYDKALVISKNAQSDAKKRYREFLRSQDLLKKIDAIKRTAPPEVVESIERALKESKGYLTSGQYGKFNRVAENLIQELRSD
ncbi:MAG TPA: hypothetical protein EYP43_02510, partial [Thermoplasmata archaeon]|nr:hypothetical protein [Thermoplasmata archaeon]